MDGAATAKVSTLTAAEVRAFLLENREVLRNDAELLAELGLRPDSGNVVDFGPAALARVHAAHKRESKARKALEDTARANFVAQAQTHGAVVDLLESRNHADLARRVDDLARQRFGLAAGVVCLEDEAPAGWRMLAPTQIDMLIGHDRLAYMGFQPTALGLFGDQADQVKSMAMVRMALWEPARQGLLVFGSSDPEAFTPEMGSELVAFLARVVERTAERWPAPASA
jgi:uncharacterized protein YigA (DUF484 family)